jgi:hypothetical protein
MCCNWGLSLFFLLNIMKRSSLTFEKKTLMDEYILSYNNELCVKDYNTSTLNK